MSDTPTHDVQALRENVAYYDKEIARLEAERGRTKLLQSVEADALAQKHRDSLARADEALRSHSQNRHNAIMALADCVIAEAETNPKDASHA